MYRRGFTLIEIMIAIMVFAIGILTVLRVMTQNTVLLAHSKDKIQASLLAREWLELLTHIVANNKNQGIGRDCVPDPRIFSAKQVTEEYACQTTLHDLAQEGKHIIIAYDPNTTISLSILSPSSGSIYGQLYQIYTDEQVIYTHHTGQQTMFTRYLSFTGIRDEQGVVLPLDQALHVQSTVMYNRWNKASELILDTFIAEF